jgi:tetratricopeptide (TPR) repeat protein
MTLGLVAAMAGALFAAGPTGPLPASPAARDALDRGRTAFGRAEYQRAIEILYPLLYPDNLLDSESETVQARRMLAVAYLFENKPDDARREYVRLLESRPDYRFDPLLDSRRVVDFFEAVYKEHEEEIAKWKKRRQEIERLRAEQRAEQRKRELAALNLQPTIVRYERHSFAINFVPFGAGQFQNGERKKGWFFFGAEALLGAVSLGAFATNLGLYGLTPTRGCKDPQPTPTDCFFAVAIWGVIDAIVRFQPEVLLPEGAKVANGRPPASRLTFSPNGLGASWAF